MAKNRQRIPKGITQKEDGRWYVRKMIGGNLTENVHIRSLNAYGVEKKFLFTFSLMNELRHIAPVIRRSAVGKQEDPGSKVRNTVRLVIRLFLKRVAFGYHDLDYFLFKLRAAFPGG